MEKKNIDWSNLGFGYMVTDKRYVSMFKNGAWDDGALISDDKIVMSEDAGVLHYSQSIFEGLKAYTTEDGRIVCFRPDLNADRMYNSALRMEMPPFPRERFIDSVVQTVKANAAWVPPYGTGATLYVRPLMFGISPVIGVKPAEEYMYRVFVTPVGPYFKGGATPIAIKVSDYDRAAPRGTGHIKAYLDPATRTKIEETGGANIIFVDADGNLVIPTSDSILPSITRRSIHYVAEHYLGLKVTERVVTLKEVEDGNFKEAGLCGTAAVISPLGCINDHGKEIFFSNGMEKVGPVIQKLYDTLTGIQAGRIEPPEGWIVEIC